LVISKRSFYCGDAGGRTEPSEFRRTLYKKSKKDFSDTDRKFAYNLKIKYLTPEEFFLENPEDIPYTFSGLDPEKFLKNHVSSDYEFKYRSKEMIILVGPPGSGKSTFVEKHLEDYHRINLDTCKT